MQGINHRWLGRLQVDRDARGTCLCKERKYINVVRKAGILSKKCGWPQGYYCLLALWASASLLDKRCEIH